VRFNSNAPQNTRRSCKEHPSPHRYTRTPHTYTPHKLKPPVPLSDRASPLVRQLSPGFDSRSTNRTQLLPFQLPRHPGSCPAFDSRSTARTRKPTYTSTLNSFCNSISQIPGLLFRLDFLYLATQVGDVPSRLFDALLKHSAARFYSLFNPTRVRNRTPT
jgi:hypothetical protein